MEFVFAFVFHDITINRLYNNIQNKHFEGYFSCANIIECNFFQPSTSLSLSHK